MSEPAVPGSDPIRPRIGDAERDQAVAYLQEHMAQGRLDQQEFDERLSRALTAKTAADLEPLFADLPDPRPDSAGTPPPTPPAPWASTSAAATPAVPEGASALPAASTGTPRWATAVLAGIWPAAILLSFATHFTAWWIWLVAALVTYVVRRTFVVAEPKPGPPEDGQDRRQLDR